MNITIYHNPRCSTSRNALAAIRAAGHEPRIVEYLVTPLSREQLLDLLAASGLSPREAIRSKETLFGELGLDAPETGDAQLVEAMLAHPMLLNRPFVATPKGTRLCRPLEKLDEVL
ncbi:arsenate reductase (glutaredoxin) [Massilia sp. GCM10023247]|uniref:arsenate reductase (glutaredoxin) n=1 Tax=Massilia sp. GCM10023247 TaxID=3252643 RepID=UPI0036166F56